MKIGTLHYNHFLNIFVVSLFRAGSNSFPNSILMKIKTKNVDYMCAHACQITNVALLVNEGFRTVYGNLFFQCHS